MAVRQLEAGRAEVENQYARTVARDGNRAARDARSSRCSRSCDRKWRGVGAIPKSGYQLRDEYRAHDAERLFEVGAIDTARAGARASAASSCAA